MYKEIDDFEKTSLYNSKLCLRELLFIVGIYGSIN